MRSRTIRREQERRGAVSRNWLQAIDDEVVATLDEAPTPWGLRSFKVTAHTIFAQSRGAAAAAERSLMLLGRPSREVTLSFIGAQC